MDVKAKRNQKKIDIKHVVAVKPSGYHSKWMSQKMDVENSWLSKANGCRCKFMFPICFPTCKILAHDSSTYAKCQGSKVGKMQFDVQGLK